MKFKKVTAACLEVVEPSVTPEDLLERTADVIADLENMDDEEREIIGQFMTDGTSYDEALQLLKEIHHD
jgi:hypothetical protein